MPTKNLRNLLAQDDDKFELTKILFSLKDAEDYSIVLVGSSKLELAIRKAIEHSFKHKDGALIKRMFDEPTAPLSSLSAKNSLAFAMGLYDQKTYKDIETIRNIRNSFAHLNSVLKIEQNEIANLIKNLNVTKVHFTSETIEEHPAKHFFLLAISKLGNGVIAPLIWSQPENLESN